MNSTPNLYYWLVYLELEKALDEFGTMHGYLNRVTLTSIDSKEIAETETTINNYKALPFYKRIFASLFSNINELILLQHFYKAKHILEKLKISTDFNKVEWNKALDELKLLDKEVYKHLSFFNFQYFYAYIKEWPVKAKNKKYIFDDVNYAFSNPENWNVQSLKKMNLRELRKIKSVNQITEYLYKQAENYCSEDNILNVTHDQLDTHKWRLSEYNNAVSSYYNTESWVSQSSSKCKSIIETIGVYLNDAILVLNMLHPIATYNRCIAVFRTDSSPSNKAALDESAIAIRDHKPIQHDRRSSWQKFFSQGLESNLSLHHETFDHVEEYKKIKISEEQYRWAHLRK